MINKCLSKTCSLYIGRSTMKGLPCCEKYPNGIPHAKVMGLDTCPWFQREETLPGSGVKGDHHGQASEGAR